MNTIKPGLARHLGRLAGHLLTFLGPGYAKVGQIASTRSDLLPIWLCEGLKEVLATSRAGGRGSVATVVASQDTTTCAILAEKRIHPRSRNTLNRNLITLQKVMNIAAKLPPFHGVPLSTMTTDICNAVAAQTDLVRERESLIRLRDMLSSDTIHVPCVHDKYCSETVLTMDWIDHDPALSLARLPSETRNRIMTILVEALLQMIFVHGYFHCDLHPGNWWPVSRSRIVIIDAGFMYELDPEARWHFIEFFYGIAFGDGEHAFNHMISTSDPNDLPDSAELELLRDEVVTLVEEQYDAPVTDFSLAAFGASLFQIQRRHGFQGDTSFIFPLIALLSIEGQLKQFAPDLEFQAIARRQLGRPLLKLRATFGKSLDSDLLH